MTNSTKQHILKTAKELFAAHGYEGLSMRTLAEQSNVGLSSIYHFFADKDILLETIFNSTNTQLGRERSLLPNCKTASRQLAQLIKFQFAHMADVSFVLKYFLHYRAKFENLKPGFVPAKAYLHVEEILIKGNSTGEFSIPPEQIASEAKVITHAINGFLLEYYPESPRGRELNELVSSIHQFIYRSMSH